MAHVLSKAFSCFSSWENSIAGLTSRLTPQVDLIFHRRTSFGGAYELSPFPFGLFWAPCWIVVEDLGIFPTFQKTLKL